MVETELVRRVRQSLTRRDDVIRELYGDSAIKKAVVGTLIKMGCSKQEAPDYFVDAIVNFIKSCYREDFQIHSNITNYLIGTAKNIWLKRVTKTKKEGLLYQSIENKDQESPEVILINDETKTTLNTLLSLIDETCRKVLPLWANKQRMNSIAQKMNYKSEGMARKKKHQCLQRLYAIIDDNPSLKEDLRAML